MFYCSLINDKANSEMALHILRWKQTAEFGILPNKKMPHSFYVDTTDFYGEVAFIHEPEKQRPAQRFAQIAAKEVYGLEGFDNRGPFPKLFRKGRLVFSIEVVYDKAISYKDNTSYSGIFHSCELRDLHELRRLCQYLGFYTCCG